MQLIPLVLFAVTSTVTTQLHWPLSSIFLHLHGLTWTHQPVKDSSTSVPYFVLWPSKGGLHDFLLTRVALTWPYLRLGLVSHEARGLYGWSVCHQVSYLGFGISMVQYNKALVSRMNLHVKIFFHSFMTWSTSLLEWISISGRGLKRRNEFAGIPIWLQPSITLTLLFQKSSWNCGAQLCHRRTTLTWIGLP